MTSQLTAASKTLPSSMTTTRSGLAAAVVNGKLFAVGGYGFGRMDSIESCDVMNGGRWTEAPSKMNQRREGCAAAAIGNSVFVAGGIDDYGSYLSSVEEFNVETGLWTSLPSMSTPRHYCAAVSIGDELIVVGGQDDSYQVLNTAESFNIRTGRRWMDLPPMNNTRRGCAAAAMGRYLLVAGGYDGTSNLNTVEVFDVDTETWRECPPMTTTRWGCAAVSLGGSVFIMGGLDKYGRFLDSVEEISFNDDVIRGMLVECSGGSWRNDVMPLLRWRAPVIHKFGIDINSMLSLLSRVGGESRVQTVYEILRGEIGVFKHTALT